MVRTTILVAGVFAACGACSGGGEQAATAVASTTIAAPSATAAPTSPSTTVAATAVPATTVVAATAETRVAPTVAETTAVTTVATTSTTVPEAAETTVATTDDPFLEEAVRARFDVLERVEAAWAATRRMFNDPLDDDLIAALDDHYTGNQLEGFNNLIQPFRDGNFRTIPNEDHPEMYRADPVSLALDFEGGRATVQACHINTALIVETGGNPDGTDRVVRDEIIEEIVELTVVRIDGVWKVSNAHTPETEIATCP